MAGREQSCGERELLLWGSARRCVQALRLPTCLDVGMRVCHVLECVYGCMCTRVYVLVCMSLWVYVSAVCMHVCILCAYMLRVSIYVCASVCKCVDLNMYVRVYTGVCACVSAGA